jgi:hypothetical protein
LVLVLRCYIDCDGDDDDDIDGDDDDDAAADDDDDDGHGHCDSIDGHGDDCDVARRQFEAPTSFFHFSSIFSSLSHHFAAFIFSCCRNICGCRHLPPLQALPPRRSMMRDR